jgi:hypothetical protein
MKKLLVILLLIYALSPQGFAQEESENLTPDYINGVFYYKRLDYMRHSYDKARMLNKEGYGGWLGGIFSVMYDFNYGTDMDRIGARPMLLGFALGDGQHKRWGFHFLGYGTGNAAIGNTDLDNRAFDREFKKALSPHRFRAYTVGGSLDLNYFSVTADASLINNVPSVYGRLFIPFLKTHIGLGTSQFDEIIDPVDQQKKIIRSKVFNIDHLSFATSSIPYFNLGLKIYRITQRRFSPNISMAAHQFFKRSQWDDMNWDADIFFETRGGKLSDLSAFNDFESRFTVYRLFWKNVSYDDAPILLRSTVFAGVSYKSEIDYLDQTLTESGMVYNGQSGFGYEACIGLRVLGFRKFGFEEDTYVRLSYYNNYSGYYDRFPGMTQGVKFKVIL